jgi:hypothetical protein
MKIRLWLLVFMISAVQVVGQNLCPNPSFENNTGCPNSVAQVPLATPWNNPTNHTGSADYFHTCGTGLVTVPANFAGTENPATGNGYVGLCLYYNTTFDFREYIEIQLTQPLVAGQCYEFSFKYSQAENTEFATDRFGAYFSAAPLVGSGNYFPFAVAPQAPNPTGNFLNVTNGWAQVTISFTAAGGEQYMLLGNYYNDASTTVQQINPGAAYGASYIYLDDISVTPCATSAVIAGADDTICIGQTAQLTATGGTGNFWWDAASLPNDTVGLGSPVVVSPTATTVYVVHSGSQTDTMIINVVAPPVVTASADTSVCAGAPVTFTASASPGSSYLWNTTATTNTITVTNPGTYVVTVSSIPGCSSNDTVVLTNLPSPVVALNNLTMCLGGQVTMNAGNPGCSYSWNTGDTTQAIVINTPGTYSVVVTNVGGCSATSSAVVSILNTLNSTVATNMISCFGGNNGTASVTVTGGNNPYSYLWSTTDTTASINNLSSGVYTVIVTDASGCYDSVQVVVAEPPVLTLQTTAAPAIVCSGQQATLNANTSGGTPSYSTLWNPGNLSGNPSVSPLASTTYTTVVTDANGCTATDSVTVTVSAAPVTLFVADSLAGCAPLCVNFSDLSTVLAPAVITAWDWNFGDQTNSTQQNPTHCYSNSGNYTVTLTVKTADGCQQTITMSNYITVFPTPVAAFSMSPQPTTLFNAEIFFTDHSTNAVSWQWSFGDVNNSSSTLQNPSFTYSAPTCYEAHLTVTGNGGCSDSISQDVCIDPDIAIYVPNAFTPNGNNNNEVFLPVGTGIDPARYQLWIFDRWGNMIFSTTDLNQGWNGHANGGAEIAQIDTYVWKIMVWDIQGSMHTLMGSVNLIK